MTDVLTKEQRHLNMSHIRGRDTSIDLIGTESDETAEFMIELYGRSSHLKIAAL